MGHLFSMAMLVITRLGIQLKGSSFYHFSTPCAMMHWLQIWSGPHWKIPATTSHCRGRTPLPASDQQLGDFLPAGPQQGQLAVNAAKELPFFFNWTQFDCYLTVISLFWIDFELMNQLWLICKFAPLHWPELILSRPVDATWTHGSVRFQLRCVFGINFGESFCWQVDITRVFRSVFQTMLVTGKADKTEKLWSIVQTLTININKHPNETEKPPAKTTLPWDSNRLRILGSGG